MSAFGITDNKLDFDTTENTTKLSKETLPAPINVDLLNKAVEDMLKCSSRDEMGKIWEANKAFQKQTRFINATRTTGEKIPKSMKKTVTFNEENHTYNMTWVRNGEDCSKHLSGITGLLSKHLFPNKYIGVSEDVLMAAAAKGSAIHKALQVYVSTGFVLERYEELCKKL